MKNQQTILDITKLAFSEQGPLSLLIDNYTPNPTQVAYAEKVAACFMNGSNKKPSIGLIEAGTGIGKTLGYAIPLFAFAALTGKRVAISTFTTQLQAQLLRPGSDIDIAQKIVSALTGISLTVVPRLGLRNFVSHSRVCDAVSLIKSPDKKSKDLLNKFLSWSQHSSTGLFYEWNLDYGDIPSGLSISDICCENYLPDSEKIRYENHRQLSKNSDVIITNHALTLMHARFPNHLIFDDTGHRKISIIVADEADRIETAASNLDNNSAALVSINSFFKKNDDKLSSVISNHISDIQELTKSLESLSTKKSSYINLRDMPNESVQLSTCLNNLLPLLNKALTKCKDPELLSELTIYRDSFSLFKSYLFKDSGYAIPVVHYSEVRRNPSLRLIDINPSSKFGLLWQDGTEKNPHSYLESCLLTSATLSDGSNSSLKSTANTMGLFRSSNYHLYTDIFEPDHFGHLSFVLPDQTAPLPTLSLSDDEYSTSPDWVNYVADMIVEASKSGERTLALSLSFRDTKLIANRLREQLPNPGQVIEHSPSDPLPYLLTKFSNSEGVILISPSCWEGVNLPGIVKNLVITRIPFSPPDNVRADIIKQTMKKKGITFKVIDATVYGMSVISTRRKLRQALGRPIRQKSDSSRIWFGDKRILSQNGKLKLESCIPARFLDNLKLSDTFSFKMDSSANAVIPVKPVDPWKSNFFYY